MAEPIAWRDLWLGDVLEVNRTGWTVTELRWLSSDRLTVTLKSQAGVERTGRPEPGGVVTVLERGPEPTDTAMAALAVLKPEPVCGHWIGDEDRYCASDQNVRPFLSGHRCQEHSPGLVQARAAGRKACLGCGQPIPADAEPADKCLVCRKPATAKTARGRR